MSKYKCVCCGFETPEDFEIPPEKCPICLAEEVDFQSVQ